MLVSEHLYLNMPWLLDVLLNEHMVVTETLHAFSLGGIKLIKEFAFMLYNSHSFPTTAKRCLEHDWESNLVRLSE